MASLLGAGYDSSDDDSAPAPSATKIVAAPEVNTEVWSLQLFLASPRPENQDPRPLFLKHFRSIAIMSSGI